MNNIFSEKILVSKVYNLLKRRGYAVAKEVPFLSRSIDLVCRNKNGEIVAIEIKIKKWDKALKQAKYCLLGTSKVYVYLSSVTVTKEIKESFGGIGVGLTVINIGTNGRICTSSILEPTNHSIEWMPFRDMLTNSFFRRLHNRGKS
jgi:hypothetical protein